MSDLHRWGRRATDRPRFALRKRADRGGEGSRGGHVIGHTKSGKPIYGSKDTPHLEAGRNFHGHAHEFVSKNSAGYTSKDHHEAAKASLEHAKKLRAAGDNKGAFFHGAVAELHKMIARGKVSYPGFKGG